MNHIVSVVVYNLLTIGQEEKARHAQLICACACVFFGLFIQFLFIFYLFILDMYMY